MGACDDTWNIEINILVYESERFPLLTELINIVEIKLHFKAMLMLFLCHPLGSKEEAQDNVITKMVHIIRSVPAFSSISKKCQLCLQENLKFLNTPTQINCLIKDQSLFQSAATLSFYCLIISLTIRPGKCPIRNI